MVGYLINLDRSTDRLAHMDAQFKQLGIAYERVSAIDGRSLGDRSPDSSDQTMSRGAIGCLLSHQHVWDIVGRGNDTYAAIFEDDVHLSPRLAAFLSDWRWIPRDADLVKLETLLTAVAVDRDPSVTHGGCAVRRLRSPHRGSAGYIISAKLARFLAEGGVQTLEHSDILLFDREHGPKLDCIVYQVDPGLCVQDTRLKKARRKAASFDSVILEDEQPGETGSPTKKTVRDRLVTESRSVARLISRLFGRGPVLRKKIRFADSN